MAANQNVKEWARKNFGDCQLGDKRRTERLMKVAEQVATNPSASFPNQMPGWSDLKAAYRLFDREDVTFSSIVGPHWRATCQRKQGRYLILCDTTEIDFGLHRDVEDLAPLGNGTGRGFLLHNGLMVDANSEEIIGLAGQTIHYRKKAPKKETNSQRMKRERESKIWGDVVDAVGTPRDGVEFVHVCDRGGDNFELVCHFVQQRTDWVVRVSHMHRLVLTPGDEQVKLSEYLATLPVLETYELELRARPHQPSRVAKLEVRAGAIKLPVPRYRSQYVKDLAPPPIAMSVIEVREVDAPKGTKPIKWVLYTSLPATTFDETWRVIGYYEKRWLVEEFHKAYKTGCRVTGRQLKEAHRLEAAAGLMSVVAVRLLQLKSVARTDPQRPAKSVVPHLWLQMLNAVRKNLTRDHDLTVGQFYREVAKLGGFLGRKHDGQPGWITIWRGWEKLYTLVTAAELAMKLKRCG